MNAVAQQTALSTQPRQQFDLSPQTFDQALQFCDYLADSDFVPKDFKGKPGNCLIAIQWGAELGLKPLQALQNLAIINGRPALWGDAVIALACSRSTPRTWWSSSARPASPYRPQAISPSRQAVQRAFLLLRA